MGKENKRGEKKRSRKKMDGRRRERKEGKSMTQFSAFAKLQ